ncbi:MAG: helix-turn-helix domain-containing protein [Phycisphaerae bacterium]
MQPSNRICNMTLGFFGSLEPTTPMGYFQRHNEIEINFGYKSFDYTIGGKTVRIPAKHLAIFWAINPHEITWIESDGGHHFHITIPLPWFLSWPLPGNFVRRILAGEVLLETLQIQRTKDEQLIQQWRQDLAIDDAVLHNAVLCELQGRLLRLASSLIANDPSQTQMRSGNTTSDSQMEKVALMAKFVAEHGHEFITITDIAAVAKLHPNYATNLFHEICGVSPIKFLITHRITLAQILLVSTSKKIVTIAFECGFNSVSQFYAHFQKFNKITPSQYRNDITQKNLSRLAKHHN